MRVPCGYSEASGIAFEGRVEKNIKRSEMPGPNVFVGHCSSLIWRELKDLIVVLESKRELDKGLTH
jgi:hypothetical protein